MEITDENFTKYFFPAKADYKPKKGQVLARWRAKADFVDGWVKRNVIELLVSNKAGANTAKSIMKNLVSASDEDAIAIPRQMAQDLVNGMSIDAVAEKLYRFTVEQFYWTEKECVPKDPHWDVIEMKEVFTPDK